MPKVSVIVPIYNVEPYLPTALKSLKNQSLEDVEFICINNGSEDKSSEILDTFAKENKKFIVIDHEKKAIGTVRNEGIDIAKGDYIAFMDSDDTFEKSALEKLSSLAEKQKTDMILYNYRKVDEHYNPIKNGERSIAECVKDYANLSDNEVFGWRKIKPKIFGLGGSFWSAWSKFFNAKFLKDNNIRFSDYNLCEDHLFTVKSLLKAQRIGYKENPIYNYMVRIGSASRPINPNDDNMHAALNTFKQIKAFLADIKLQKELKQEFNKYVSDTTMHILPKILSQDEFKKQSAEILLQ